MDTNDHVPLQPDPGSLNHIPVDQLLQAEVWSSVSLSGVPVVSVDKRLAPVVDSTTSLPDQILGRTALCAFELLDVPVGEPNIGGTCPSGRVPPPLSKEFL